MRLARLLTRCSDLLFSLQRSPRSSPVLSRFRLRNPSEHEILFTIWEKGTAYVSAAF